MTNSEYKPDLIELRDDLNTAIAYCEQNPDLSDIPPVPSDRQTLRRIIKWIIDQIS